VALPTAAAVWDKGILYAFIDKTVVRSIISMFGDSEVFNALKSGLYTWQ
jgi:hypothetical protein